MVRLAQNPDQPGIVVTIDVVILVSHPEVSKDVCVIWVIRVDCGPPVE
jgi:hypothetical protein